MANATGRATARIKQLSCLGHGGEAIMPALFQELSALFPYYSSSFFFLDEMGLTSNVYPREPTGRDLWNSTLGSSTTGVTKRCHSILRGKCAPVSGPTVLNRC